MAKFPIMMIENDSILPSKTGADWHLPGCFGCGQDNIHGLHADFPFDEETGEVRFVYRPTIHHMGAPDFVHGGVLATIMDESQGVLCFHVGHMIMTDRLYMKYHKATRLDSPFRVRCWITAVRKRRMYTRGTIQSMEDELLVSSSAVWYLLPDRLARRLVYSGERAEEYEKLRIVMEANRKRAREIRLRLRDKNG